MRKRHRLAQLLRRFDPRDDDAIRADVERSLDEADVALRDADERDGVAANRRAHVLDDVLPVEMAMLGVDHDPVEAQRDGHLGDAADFPA